MGEGYSGIAVDGGKLYTMYRVSASKAGSKFDREVIVALDAQTGKTLWEDPYDAPFESGMQMENGPGPHVTPLVLGNQVYTVGITGKFYCKDKNTGKTLWYHDLIKDYRSPMRGRGYSCSPVAYKQTVILPVGGTGQAMMAFNQKDGSVAWKKHNLTSSPSSPLIINVDGQDQLVAFLGDVIAGLDPNNGDLLWSHPHKTDWGLNISTPVWSASDHLLFVSSAYNTGSRAIELHQAGGRTSVAEKWFSSRMRVHIGTIIRLGDYIYASSGDFGPSFLTALDVKSGKVVWQDRSFARAQLLYADNKLIILDEDGNLGLATVSPQGLKVLSRASVLSNISWTPPTLSGTTLYARDRKNIAAFSLGS